MAKKGKQMSEENSEATVEGEGTEAKGAGRGISVTLADGRIVKRLDYIRELWVAGKTRREITDMINEVSAKPIAYQIVFAGTKGVARDPSFDVKPAKASAEAASVSEDA